MQQYFENRKLTKVEDITIKTVGAGCKYENLLFANERIDKGWKSQNCHINNSTFAKMGFKESSFKGDDLRFNVFIDCYFKKTTFEDVKFNTCIFINCSFDEATFVNCSFDYARFEGGVIPYHAMYATLPGRENIRWNLCKNLALESLKLGQEDEYRRYFFEEKKASELYFWNKFWHKGDDPYYKKYNGAEQVSGLIHFCLSKANKVLWGYGEKLTRLIFNIVIVWVAFAGAYYFGLPTLDETSKISVQDAFYMSLSNFFTVTCDYTSTDFTYRILSVLEGGIGIVLMGFFGAALFRNINRRG